jgi:hypothetical protein
MHEVPDFVVPQGEAANVWWSEIAEAHLPQNRTLHDPGNRDSGNRKKDI